jgi:hypothetical protein
MKLSSGKNSAVIGSTIVIDDGLQEERPWADQSTAAFLVSPSMCPTTAFRVLT